MFTLKLECDSTAADLRRGLGITRVQIWRDLTDSVCAYGYAGPGWWAMEWPGLGTFRFGPVFGETVEVIPEPGVSVERIEDLYRRSVLPLVLQAFGRETLHASAVTGSRGVLAFCGRRGAGKSTVAYGLRRRGFEQHADDTLVLTIASNEVTTLPLPFSPRLRPASADFFENAAQKHSLSTCEPPAAEPLAAVFILRPSEQAGPLTISALAPTEAFQAALAHAHCFDTEDPAGRRRLLQNYLEIAACVPMFDVPYQPGLERFDALLDALLTSAVETTAMSVAV